MNDDFLNQFRRAPRKEFASDLYKRISDPMTTYPSTRKSTPVRRLAIAFATLSLVLFVGLAASPAAQARASELLRRIGAITLVDRSGAHVAEPEGAAVPTAEPFDGSTVQSAPDAAAATKLAGFAVLIPTSLPDGYAPAGEWSIAPQASGTIVASFYRGGTGAFLGLNQYRYGAGDGFDQSVGQNEQITDVTVRGVGGVAVSGRLMTDPTDSTGDSALRPSNWLMWEENGVVYSLFSDELSTQQLIDIAEGLK